MYLQDVPPGDSVPKLSPGKIDFILIRSRTDWKKSQTIFLYLLQYVQIARKLFI